MRPRDLVPSSPARLAVVAGAGVVALYVIFTVVPVARRIDGAVVHRDLDRSWELAASIPGTLIRSSVIVIAVLVLGWFALRDHRPVDAVRVVALIALAVVLSRALKGSLEALDPLGGEGERALGPGWYPSGHAATAMSLGLAALIAAPAAAHSRTLILAAGAWPAIAGWALASDAGHHPSDIAGGLFLATALAGALVVGRPADLRVPAAIPWRVVGAGVGVLMLGCGVLAAFDGLRVPHSAFQPALILAATALALIALGLVQRFDRALVAGNLRAPATGERGEPATSGGPG